MAAFGLGEIESATAADALLAEFQRDQLAADIKARIIEAQLELVRTNVRVLDYAFPLAGAMLVALHGSRSSSPLGAWVVVVVASAMNETVLLRRSAHHEDVITRVRENAKTITFAIFSLLMAWATFSFSLWSGNGDGHLLTILVLACTLAATSSMFAWHATAHERSPIQAPPFMWRSPGKACATTLAGRWVERIAQSILRAGLTPGGAVLAQNPGTRWHQAV